MARVHRQTAFRIWAVLAVATQVVLTALPGGAEVRPGETITKDNSAKINGLVSEGVLWCVNRRMEMKMVHDRSAGQRGALMPSRREDACARG